MNALKLATALVSTEWLAKNLDHPQLIVLDASMKPVGKAAAVPDPNATLQIPHSQVFDFDQKICDRSNPLPHMMPSAVQFESDVCELGVNQDSVIVVYDRVGIYSCPRAYWMFKAMGHDAVAVLDGGLPAWLQEGRRTETVASRQTPTPGNFKAQLRPQYFCSADRVEKALKDHTQAVLDARSEGRFYGREPEPRKGLRAGHMPGAVNIPFSKVQKDGHLLPADKLAELFRFKIGDRKTLVTSCGSGVTACVIAFAAQMAGYNDVAVYDGSWCEWGLVGSRVVTTE